MKRATEMEWTDGVGKVLSTLGSLLTKQEKAVHHADEAYTSDPMLMVTDLQTGANVLLQTEEHTGGRTQGNGYKKEAGYEQKIPMKVPMNLQRNILLDMVVCMLVPKEDDRVGPLGKAVYERIANAIKEGHEKSISTDKDLAEYWKGRYGNHSSLVEQIVADINDMTVTKMTGKSFCKMEAIPIEQAVIDTTGWDTLIQEAIVEDEGVSA